MTHLDNIYRDRWQEYHLATGEIADSRKINWRQVEWEKVVKIVTHLAGKSYVLNCNQPDFKFFVIYRNGGFEGNKPIHEWAVGWSDGKNCFMTDYDFKAGTVLRQYVVSVEKTRAHIHPRIKIYD